MNFFTYPATSSQATYEFQLESDIIRRLVVKSLLAFWRMLWQQCLVVLCKVANNCTSSRVTIFVVFQALYTNI